MHRLASHSRQLLEASRNFIKATPIGFDPKSSEFLHAHLDLEVVIAKIDGTWPTEQETT